MSGQFFDMSDEDFANLSGPPETQETGTATVETPEVNPPTETVEEIVEETQQVTEPEPKEEETEEDKGEPENPLAVADDELKTPEIKETKQEEKVDEPKKTETDPAGSPDKDAADKPKTETEQVTPDYKAFYDQLIGKPIRANGKEITLRNPDEALRLIQMGAGYGKKLQDLQPHLKTLKMLEANDLLDPTQLSYLIDIRNKNPDAIKNLIKESGIDPLDLNPGDNVDYKPQDHSVSDAQIRFQEALEEVTSLPQGAEVVQIINQKWDAESKQLLWDSPEILSIIQTQKVSGVYDQIASEVDRQKLLGSIPPHTPFLKAYEIAGKALFGQPQETTTTTPEVKAPVAQPATEPKVLATRPAAPKAPVKNDDKARAAAPTQATARKAAPVINPLEMADDEFLKTFKL
jgi:hypothetical protein